MNHVFNKVQLLRCILPSIPPHSLSSGVQSTALNAAMPVLDWQTVGTSDYFRGASNGIPFGRVSICVEVVSGRNEVLKLQWQWRKEPSGKLWGLVR